MGWVRLDVLGLDGLDGVLGLDGLNASFCPSLGAVSIPCNCGCP